MQEMPSILGALRLLGMDPNHARDRSELGPLEAAWLSGYFAALARGRSPNDESAALAHALWSKLGAKERGHSSAPVRVLYGSETGNAAGVAQKLVELLRARAQPVELTDIADYQARSLAREQTVVLTTSTHGDGTPPETARRFYEQLAGGTAAKSLEQLRFAVLGLGDSSYEHFCRAARTADERFEALGATRLLPRVDCDLDFEEPAARWCERLLEVLGDAPRPSLADVREVHVAAARVAEPSATYDRQRPYYATVLENFALTGRGSSKETRHLSLNLGDSGLRFAPGDALGLAAPNDPELVAELIAAIGASGEEPVVLGGLEFALADALREQVDITVLTPRLLGAWAELASSAELALLTRAGRDDERRAFLREHHLIDLVRAYPARVAPELFVQALRRLTPRLYSIASSQLALEDEVHLTIAVVCYELKSRVRAGVVSGHVATRVGEGDALPVYVQANPRFRLPSDGDRPIVMIGAGTGVAPFRAFVQERAARGARGPSWLFFGERNFRTDFLYQTEWQSSLRAGALSKLSLAFSRDQAEKVYVQQRLCEHGRELFRWLEQGAHVYVCGDATSLAPAVHEALLAIVEAELGSRERAGEYLRSLEDASRYQRDVY